MRSFKNARKVRSFVYLKKINAESATGYHTCQEDSYKAKECLIHALTSFLRTFAVGFGLRAGLALALRAISLVKKNSLSLFTLEDLLDEKHLRVRVDAVRIGLFLGTFTGGFNYLHCSIRRFYLWYFPKDLTPQKENKITLVAGFLAGLSILSQNNTRRRWFALLASVRLLQCIYNETKRRMMIRYPQKTKWFNAQSNSDALLFMITSAQIMYAYIMRPDTLPANYHKFIVQSGPIHPDVLTAVRNNCRKIPFDKGAVMNFVHSNLSSDKFAAFSIAQNPLPLVGCDILHPVESSCSKNAVYVFISTFKKIYPLYLSLTFVPMFLLRLFKVIQAPLFEISFGFLSAARSTSFLATFCAGFQSIVCLHHNVAKYDNKVLFWIAGFITSLSILLERKSRRAELALYALPRAMDSLWIILKDHGLVPTVPYGDVLLFCLSSSGLMYFHHNHLYRTTVPILTKIFNWMFDKKRQEQELNNISPLSLPYTMPSTPLTPSSTFSDSTTPHLK